MARTSCLLFHQRYTAVYDPPNRFQTYGVIHGPTCPIIHSLAVLVLYKYHDYSESKTPFSLLSEMDCGHIIEI